jgi:hypothetical protein
MGRVMKMLPFPWDLVALSSTVSVACGVAIVGFGAPPAILVLASWALAPFYASIKPRIDRRLDRR